MKNNFLNHIDKTWTLFLDRDGVINSRIWGGYVTKPAEYNFLPGVLDSIAFFTSFFGKIIIVTNQQGIGKGIMTEQNLATVHNYMNYEISNACGKIDSIYYCTDLAEKNDNCRKPSITMAQNAVHDFPEIDLTKSIMVGDSQSDIDFGRNAGMHTVLVKHDNEDISICNADIEVKSLAELKSQIEKLKQL